MIGIREPKYKFGDKVYCKQYKSSAIITGISDYSFAKDKYFYNVEWEHDDYLDEIHEDLLEPYIEKPKSVWDLKKGDTYYLIDVTGDVIEANWLGYWLDYDNDKRSRKIGNAFLTKEEAENEVERRKIEAEMLRLGGRRKFNRGKDNYFIMYTRIEGLDYVNYHSMHEQGVIYFDSELDAINAVKTIGKDRIEKYIFGVDE